MDFKTYTTKDLEFITTHFEELKKELKKRNNKSNLFFGVGDVICSKSDNDDLFFFLKIKEIDKRNNNIIADEITIGNGVNFQLYIDEWFDYDGDWDKYKKVKNQDIYFEIENIINEYNEKIDKLYDETYESLTQLIENEL